jgi:hypothetical protein
LVLDPRWLLLPLAAALACGNSRGVALDDSGGSTASSTGASTSSSSTGTSSSASTGTTSGTTTAGSSSTSSSGSSSSSSTTSSSTSGAPPVAIPLTGCVGLGYSVPVTIGSQSFALSVDTGSTDLAVAQSTCTDCGVSPEYAAPGGSCAGKTSSNYGAGALSGGSWNAQICSADVQVGAEQPPVTISVAGITDQKNFFYDYGCPGTANQGILGLGELGLDTIGTSPTDAYFPALVQQGVPDIVSLLLCSNKGLLWFGGYDPSYASGPPQYTPMSQFYSWAVDLKSIGYGTQDLGGGDSDSIVDTGTWGFYMWHAAYTALVAAVGADPAAATTFGAGTLDATFFSSNGCAAPLGGQTQAQIDAALPPLTLTLPAMSGGTFTLSLPATQSYLAAYPGNGPNQYCAGVADSSMTGNVTLIGGTVLQAYITILDEGAQRIGFAPQSYCP